MGKNAVQILTLFLIALVTFFALQIINNFTKSPIEAPEQKLIEKLDPNLNNEVLEALKSAPQ